MPASFALTIYAGGMKNGALLIWHQPISQ